MPRVSTLQVKGRLKGTKVNKCGGNSPMWLYLEHRLYSTFIFWSWYQINVMSYKFHVNTTNTFTPNHFNVHGGQSTQCLYKLVKKCHLFIKKVESHTRMSGYRLWNWISKCKKNKLIKENTDELCFYHPIFVYFY